MYTAQYTVH